MEKNLEQQIRVAINYITHTAALRITESPLVQEALKLIIAVDIWEMWALTQE